MKKIIVTLLMVFALIIAGLSINTTETEASKNEVIYYIPHPDDEILTFGVSIFAHLQSGKNVHLVLMTNGEGSIIKKRLGMDAKEFGDARKREFEMSAEKLGVPKENLHFLNLGDGKVKQSTMESVMADFERTYPQASHKTFSWTDPHNDHRVAGKALKSLSDKRIISDARYYVKHQDTANSPSRLMKDGYKSYYKPFIVASSKVYQLNNPTIGMYGIGYKSVPKSFQKIEASPVSYYHK